MKNKNAVKGTAYVSAIMLGLAGSAALANQIKVGGVEPSRGSVPVGQTSSQPNAILAKEVIVQPHDTIDTILYKQFPGQDSRVNEMAYEMMSHLPNDGAHPGNVIQPQDTILLPDDAVGGKEVYVDSSVGKLPVDIGQHGPPIVANPTSGNSG